MTQDAATTRPRQSPDSAHRTRNPLYSALIGLTTLAVLLQALWAGIFLEHDGKRDAAGNWIDIHARGAEVAIVLGVLALAVAVIKMRDRKDLIIGTVVLVVLLVLESYLGGLIRDDGKDTLTAVHVPLGMLIFGVAVWLPVRAMHARR